MSTLLEQALQGKPLECNVIDMHAHLGRYAFAIPDLEPQSVIDCMDRIGISKTIFSHMRVLSSDIIWGNDRMVEYMQTAPDRILGYIGLYPIGAEHLARRIEQWLDQGYTGLKLHNGNGHNYLHPDYDAAFAIAHERRLPVLFHTWGGPEHDEMRAINEKYPDAALIAAHAGSLNPDSYISLGRDHENIYIDTVLSRAPRGMVKRLVDGAGAEKVLWGSDIYFFSNTQQVGVVLGADISEEDKIKLLSGNTQRILDRIRH
tara:strand:- start:1679 stop:2458 length:780 start_codon:yes stop_codon:yes gene_type:complete